MPLPLSALAGCFPARPIWKRFGKTSSLSWTSDLDGALGGGASVVANLSQGTHTITATVMDSGGLNGVFVKALQQDGVAAADGRLKVGDRILLVNDDSVVGMSNSASVRMSPTLSATA